MNDDTRNGESGDTGPQGTRVFRRADIEHHISERRTDSGSTDGTESGAVLVGITGPLTGRRINLPPGRSTLGRDAANNIIVDDDSVSLVHARLVEKQGEWRVLNLLSTNGTWVNDTKVSDSALSHGDNVRFGEAEFIFHNAGGPRPAGLLDRLRRWLRGGR